ARNQLRALFTFCRRFEQCLVLPIAFGRELRRGNEPHGRRVHAVAQTCWTRAVVENVAEVRVRLSGTNFGPFVAKKTVGFRANVPGLERSGEARPASARIVLVKRAEKRLAGYDVDVDAWFVVDAGYDVD